MAEIALWNCAREAMAKAESADQRAEAAIRQLAEQREEILKLHGEIKAMKARMAKKPD